MKSVSVRASRSRFDPGRAARTRHPKRSQSLARLPWLDDRCVVFEGDQRRAVGLLRGEVVVFGGIAHARRPTSRRGAPRGRERSIARSAFLVGSGWSGGGGLAWHAADSYGLSARQNDGSVGATSSAARSSNIFAPSCCTVARASGFLSLSGVSPGRPLSGCSPGRSLVAGRCGPLLSTSSEFDFELVVAELRVRLRLGGGDAGSGDAGEVGLLAPDPDLE